MDETFELWNFVDANDRRYSFDVLVEKRRGFEFKSCIFMFQHETGGFGR